MPSDIQYSHLKIIQYIQYSTFHIPTKHEVNQTKKRISWLMGWNNILQLQIYIYRTDNGTNNDINLCKYCTVYTKLSFTSLNKAPPVIITNVFFGVMKQPINIFSLLHKDIPPPSPYPLPTTIPW